MPYLLKLLLTPPFSPPPKIQVPIFIKGLPKATCNFPDDKSYLSKSGKDDFSCYRDTMSGFPAHQNQLSRFDDTYNDRFTILVKQYLQGVLLTGSAQKSSKYGAGEKSKDANNG